jgi:hypothetical protein
MSTQDSSTTNKNTNSESSTILKEKRDSWDTNSSKTQK